MTNITNNIAQQIILRRYFVLPLFALIMQYEFEISMHLNFSYGLKIINCNDDKFLQFESTNSSYRMLLRAPWHLKLMCTKFYLFVAVVTFPIQWPLLDDLVFPLDDVSVVLLH
ncbi:hypothetical protein V1478_010693 [Vespula squamosa]|uniref:Uncharacterized protein n=1 Tax=Vespula squamosa TaxID=30214 RepID=A0ABD2AJD6_VESSQ